MDTTQIIEGLDKMSRADVEALSNTDLKRFETLLHHWDEMALLVMDARKKKTVEHGAVEDRRS
jgi:hypothetical protein